MLPLIEQGTEENVELCTTLGREAEKSHGRNREIIETKPGNEATMRSHVFRLPNPHSPSTACHQRLGSRPRLATTDCRHHFVKKILVGPDESNVGERVAVSTYRDVG